VRKGVVVLDLGLRIEDEQKYLIEYTLNPFQLTAS